MRFLMIALMLLVATVPAMAGQYVDYTVDDQVYQGYFSSPSPRAPLILLFHDWDGLTDYEVKRVGMLAARGYAVFAADLFGKGIRPTEVIDKRQHTGELYRDRAKLRRLLFGALQASRTLGAQVENAVAMGYCFGGAAVLEFARAGADLKGFATFHGGLGTPEGQDFGKTRGELLIMHGTADTNITMADFAGLATELEQQGVPHEMITYGGAPHAFTVFGGSRYHADADRKSWDRFLTFLDSVLRNRH